MNSNKILNLMVLTSLIWVSGCDQLPSVSSLLAGGGSSAGGSCTRESAPVAGICTDPLYEKQWHLTNTGQSGGVQCEDANVRQAWVGGYSGAGVRVAVVDDGLEIGHEDLSPNIISGGSYDYVNADTDPTDAPSDEDGHGTAVAGVAAASGVSSKGGCGVAPDAQLEGYNFLDSSTNVNLYDAMARATDISNNSWGFGGVGNFHAPDTTWESTIDYELLTGRAGKGNIFMFAAGNGDNDSSTYDDNANYSYINSFHGIMTIGAVQNNGKKSSYSDVGATVLVSAPSGEYCDTNATLTTDRTGYFGFNAGSTPFSGPVTTVLDNPNPNYTNCFNGTSSATPLASGVVALILEANPNLTWRDVRIILARSARKNDPTNTDWITNGAGYHINHNYGFGVVDAGAAVELAKTWASVGGSSSMKSYAAATPTSSVAIADGGTYRNYGAAVEKSLTISSSAIHYIEYIEVTVRANHSYAGDLDITLISPAGTTSHLAETHDCKDAYDVQVACGNAYLSGFRLSSVRHLDEAADGTWRVQVRDGWSVGAGTFDGFDIKFYGR